MAPNPRKTKRQAQSAKSKTNQMKVKPSLVKNATQGKALPTKVTRKSKETPVKPTSPSTDSSAPKGGLNESQDCSTSKVKDVDEIQKGKNDLESVIDNNASMNRNIDSAIEENGKIDQLKLDCNAQEEEGKNIQGNGNMRQHDEDKKCQYDDRARIVDPRLRAAYNRQQLNEQNNLSSEAKKRADEVKKRHEEERKRYEEEKKRYEEEKKRYEEEKERHDAEKKRHDAEKKRQEETVRLQIETKKFQEQIIKLKAETEMLKNEQLRQLNNKQHHQEKKQRGDVEKLQLEMEKQHDKTQTQQLTNNSSDSGSTISNEHRSQLPDYQEYQVEIRRLNSLLREKDEEIEMLTKQAESHKRRNKEAQKKLKIKMKKIHEYEQQELQRLQEQSRKKPRMNAYEASSQDHYYNESNMGATSSATTTSGEYDTAYNYHQPTNSGEYDAAYNYTDAYTYYE